MSPASSTAWFERQTGSPNSLTTGRTKIGRATFGFLPDGREVHELRLSNAGGMGVRILSYGGIVQSIRVPDRYGNIADVVLGHADVAGYIADSNYCGAIIGRYANRIAGGRFALDGRTYSLPQNDGNNTLHGGSRGFDKQLWSIDDIREGPRGSVRLSYVSPDGDEGFPGMLSATATYSLGEDGRLDLMLEAETDQPTIANLTGHSYFNLAGMGSGISAFAHRLWINAEHYTPIDCELIPTGTLAPVAGGPFDFREAALVSENMGDRRDEQIRLANGYDHNFILSDGDSGDVRLAARLEEPGSGRAMELWTNQPGLQFYSGNFLRTATPGKGGRLFRPNDAMALEPQLFPDTPNKSGFGSARLAPGERYRNMISYRFSTLE